MPADAFGDPDGSSLSLSAKLASGAALPAWLTFDGARFTGTPPANFNGTLDIEVLASDGALAASDVFRLTVLPVNDAPSVVSPLADLTVAEDQAFSLSLPTEGFADVDGDTLSYTLRLANGDPLPAWLSYADGAISGTPPGNFNGTLALSLTASDGTLSVSDGFTLTVLPINDAPTAQGSAPDRTVNAGEAFSFAFTGVTFSDVDGDPLTVTATLADGSSLPAWLSFDGTTFTGTAAGVVGDYQVKVRASDGSAEASVQFRLRVEQVWNYIVGTEGNNPGLIGTADRDYITGLGGDDQLYPKAGADYVDGGSGIDTVIYTNYATEGVSLSLLTGGTAGDAAGDVYVGIERVYATNYNDVIEANDLDNLILTYDGSDVVRALGGNDEIRGGLGSDTMYGGDGNDTMLFDDKDDGVADYFFGEGGDDNLRGGIYDVLEGGAGADRLELTGNNSIARGAGAGVTADGADSFEVEANLTGIQIDGGAGFDELLQTSGSDVRYTSLTSVEWVKGSSSSSNTSTITIDATSLDLSGGIVQGYVDVVAGLNADTTIKGFAGGFTNPVTRVRIYGANGNDSLTSNEQFGAEVYGNTGDDTLLGVDGNDVLDGGGDSDMLSGGNGNDILRGDGTSGFTTGGNKVVNFSFEDSGSAADDIARPYGLTTVDLPGWAVTAGRPAQLVTSASGTTPPLGSRAIKLDDGVGNVEVSQQISGFTAGEQIRLTVSSIGLNTTTSTGFEALWNGEVVLSVPNGITMSSVTASFITTQSSGTLTLRGTGAVDGVGAILDNVRLQRMAGADDRLEGGAGIDRLEGGAGDDILLGGDGNDSASQTVAGTTTGGLYGGAGRDTLDGGTGDDSLDGGDGNDRFIFRAGSGNDTVVTGGGVDELVFEGLPWDRLWFSQPSGTQDLLITALGGEASVRVTGWFSSNSNRARRVVAGDRMLSRFDVQALMGAMAAQSATVPASWPASPPQAFTDALAAAWQDAGAYVDRAVVTGTTGNDYLQPDKIWIASDSFEVWSGPVRYEGLEGNDFIDAGSSSDTILAGAGADTVFGGAGNDAITGGTGNDQIDGGTGSDTAFFAGIMTTYSLVTAGGTVSVKDNDAAADGDDGTDTIASIELLSFKNGETVSVSSPIILDLAGDGIETVSAAQSTARFDFNGDGMTDDTSWIGRGEGFLYLDRDANGTMSGAQEITFIDDLPGATSDLAGLRAFDSNADGKLDAADARFADFGVWQDANGNGAVEAGETRSLAAQGVASLGLTGTAVDGTYAFGDAAILNSGGFTLADGTSRGFADGALTYFAATEPAPALNRLPIVHGTGLGVSLRQMLDMMDGAPEGDEVLRGPGRLPALERWVLAGLVGNQAPRGGIEQADLAKKLSIIRQDLGAFGAAGADVQAWRAGESPDARDWFA